MVKNLRWGLVIAICTAVVIAPGCSKGPKRRGPANYKEYKWAKGFEPKPAAEVVEDTGNGDCGPTAKPFELDAQKIRSGSVAGTKSVKGTIKFGGKKPKIKKLNLEKDAWCAANHEVTSEEVLVGNNGGLANVIVYVKRGFNDYPFNPPEDPATLDQRGCKYVPHVTVLMAGQDLKIINSDDTSHNYHWTGRNVDEINQTQQPKAVDIRSDFSVADKGTIRCDIHGWMVTPTTIFTHPYYAVTAEDGSFEIKGLPAGKYEIGFIHERNLTAAAQEVIVADKDVTLSATLSR